MPLAWQMGAKTWQHPEVHQRWVEEEKERAAAAKKAQDEAKLAKEVEKEQRQLMRRQLVDQTRQQREDKKDVHLAQLKADVARLEMKRTGDTPDKRIALYDKTRALKHIEEREKHVGKEVKLSALEMLAIREKELDEKKKEQEKHLAELADRRRRELLEYKHALGLSSIGPHPPRRPTQLANRPLSLLDDPEFWRLDPADRHMLELMHPADRVQYGFGPYEEDEIENEPALRQPFVKPDAALPTQEKSLAHKIKSFVFTPDPNPPTLVSAADEPITLSLPLDGLPDLSTLGPEDRRTAQLIVKDESQRLRDELATFAIDEFGANALVEFGESGLVHVEEEELLAAGYVYELRAEGVPAILSHAPRLAPHHPHPARHAHFAAPPRTGASPSPWGGLGGSLGGLGGGGGNGGAGWDDEPLFGGPPAGGPAWGAPGAGGGGASWGAPGALHGAGPLPGAWAGGGGGAVWHGLKRPSAGAGAWARPDPLHGAPPELRHLPWGAQQYVKAVRERREREERERAADAYHDPFLQSHPQPVHGPSPLHPAFPRPSPLAPALAHPAAPYPALHRPETQPATVDPHDGGRLAAHGSAASRGAGAARAGLAAPVAATPAPAPAPAPAQTAASKGWGGLAAWLTGGGGGGGAGAGPSAAVEQQSGGGAAGADLRAGQAW